MFFFQYHGIPPVKHLDALTEAEYIYILMVMIVKHFDLETSKSNSIRLASVAQTIKDSVSNGFDSQGMHELMKCVECINVNKLIIWSG